MTDFTDLVNLASQRLGAAVLWADDEFFAPKENLIRDGKPVFREDAYTDRGKWMDGWETRRRREPGHDRCLLRLALPGIPRGVVVDTSHFKGNFPEACSLEVAQAPAGAMPEELERARWREVVPRSELRGDAENRFGIEGSDRATHARFHIYPDGGVARLRVFGTVSPDPDRLAPGQEADLAALENGGLVVAASDMFFGARHNLILPGPPLGMHDGWETRRRRGSGHDWAVVEMGARGMIRKVEVDTRFFKGNAPGDCSVEVTDARDTPPEGIAGQGIEWRELLPRVPLSPDSVHCFELELVAAGPASHARLNIYPDGGVARLRLFGIVSPQDR